jgi:8-oxo-dGTP pyrophosphatase MutT (NUDIX family)
MEGMLNGVGGHLEGRETPRQAMAREFEEETAIHIPLSRWMEIVQMRGRAWEVTFFRAFLSRHDIHFMTSMTDERVSLISCENENELNMVPNLSWLIPLALDDSGIQFPIAMRDTTR